MKKRARTPRDHDRSIRALRKEARGEVAMALGTGERDIARGPLLARAGAMSMAADYLASITGKIELAAKRAKR